DSDFDDTVNKLAEGEADALDVILWLRRENADGGAPAWATDYEQLTGGMCADEVIETGYAISGNMPCRRAVPANSPPHARV
ncbi:hypothetical protein OAN12_05250, partial [Halioglobus sp.]|nr:hypothetical protein [Halioglobus sp.]